jgi:hypothetical protein
MAETFDSQFNCVKEMLIHSDNILGTLEAVIHITAQLQLSKMHIAVTIHAANVVFSSGISFMSLCGSFDDIMLSLESINI